MTNDQLIIDSNFDSKALANYQCFVQLNNSSISYKICELGTNKIVAIEHKKFPTQLLLNPEKLEKCLSQCKFNIKECNRWKITIENESFALIPKALFSEETIEKHVQINSGQSQNQSCHYSINNQLNIVFAFSINKELASYLNTHFPNAHLAHHGMGLIENIYNDFDTKQEGQIFTHVKNDYLSICHFNENGLNYFNEFKITNAEDYIYYLLFVCEQLKIQTANCKAILLGEIILGEKIHHYAYNYFSKIQFGEIKSQNTLNAVFSELPTHIYYTLLKDNL